MSIVSAIITTKNRCELLERAIQSVINQTFTDIECIVIDDASTDCTREICAKYPVKYIYIPKEESRGGNYARNLGVKHSSGEYCAFLDDDDYWLPSKIEKQYNLALETKASLIYCLKIYESVVNNKFVKRKNGIPNLPEGNLKNIIYRHYITNTSCLFVRKQALQEIGLFDENLQKWQEYELMMRIAAYTDIYYVKECLCVYTINLADKQRVSNDYNRVPSTIDYIKRKHSANIKKLPVKDRIAFETMCISEKYKAAARCNLKGVKVKYFLPYIFFNLIMTISDPKALIKRIKGKVSE